METITKTFTVTITGTESDLEDVFYHTVENALNESAAFCMVKASFEVDKG